MKLKILYTDGQKEELYGIARLFTIDNRFLYFETINDAHGYGKKLRLDTIKSWEVEAVIHGTNIEI